METFSALLAICAGIHRSPVNSPHTDQWRGALMLSLICAWINETIVRLVIWDAMVLIMTPLSLLSYVCHDDVIKWKHFPRNWPFVRGIHWSTVNSPHKGQWRRALMFSLIFVWINGSVNNREAGDLRRHRAHYDVIVMTTVRHGGPCPAGFIGIYWFVSAIGNK